MIVPENLHCLAANSGCLEIIVPSLMIELKAVG